MFQAIKQQIPNALTCCNLISGCLAVSAAMVQHDLLWAFFFIVIGAVFDFCDGMSARLLHVSSPIGKELDSLADCVTFGVAPSAMAFYTLSAIVPETLSAYPYIIYLPFLMAAFSALRLAKFNLDERQTSSFIGLPTPANALFWASLTLCYAELFTQYWYTIIILVLISCWLLVAELPMFSLKFKSLKWNGNEVRFVFLAVSIALLIIMQFSAVAPIIIWYVVLAIISNILKKK